MVLGKLPVGGSDDAAPTPIGVEALRVRHTLHRTEQPPGYRDRIVGISYQVLRTPPRMTLPLGTV